MINVDVPYESLRSDISKNYKGGKSPYSLIVNQPFNPFEGGITVEFFEQEHEDRNLPEINSCDKDTLKTYLSYYLGYSALEEHNFVSIVNGQ